jgi:transposase
VINAFILLEEAVFPQGRVPRERRLVIHRDDCSIHRSRASTDSLEEHDIVLMPQSPYSPDLASIYFYLFPAVKEKLELIQLSDEN